MKYNGSAQVYDGHNSHIFCLCNLCFLFVCKKHLFHDLIFLGWAEEYNLS